MTDDDASLVVDRNVTLMRHHYVTAHCCVTGSEVRRASPDGGLSDAMTSSAENYEHLDDVSTAWINQTAGASETTVDNYSNGMSV